MAATIGGLWATSRTHASVDLPAWDGGKYRAELPDGRVVVVELRGGGVDVIFVLRTLYQPDRRPKFAILPPLLAARIRK
jgi:hypothetical protein